MRKSFATIGMTLAAAVASISIPAIATSSAFASPTTSVQGVAVPRPSPTQTTANRERREPHPEIRKAITALERAKYDMQHAAHDFGGHRVDAIAACDRAIEQLRLALKYDKN